MKCGFLLQPPKPLFTISSPLFLRLHDACKEQNSAAFWSTLKTCSISGAASDRHCRAFLAAGTSRPPAHSCYSTEVLPHAQRASWASHSPLHLQPCTSIHAQVGCWQHPAEAELSKSAPNHSHVQILEVPRVLRLSLNPFSIKMWPFLYLSSEK